MASDASLVDYICTQIANAPDVSSRKMFGEYAIYCGAKVVALVCDNQLFVKPTDAGRAILGDPIEAPPYPGAKPHYLIDDLDDLDDAEALTRLFIETSRVLPEPKPKKPRATKTRVPRARG